jgi:hypothetical protein
MIQQIDLIMNTIKGMDIKNKLRLGVCIFSSSYINISYDKAKIFNKIDAKLKEIDKEYIISFSGIENHPIVLFAASKIMELTKEEQNRIALYLVNTLNIL